MILQQEENKLDQRCFGSELTTSVPCVIPIDVVAVVPSVIGNVSPVVVLGLGVDLVWMGVVWVAGSVCGVNIVVLDWVTGLVSVVTIGKGGLFEEKVSSPCKVVISSGLEWTGHLLWSLV